MEKLKHGKFKHCHDCPALKHYTKTLKINRRYGKQYRIDNHEQEKARQKAYRIRKKEETARTCGSISSEITGNSAD